MGCNHREFTVPVEVWDNDENVLAETVARGTWDCDEYGCAPTPDFDIEDEQYSHYEALMPPSPEFPVIAVEPDSPLIDNPPF